MENFDEERNENKNKVGKQKAAIDNLLALGRQHEGLFDVAVMKKLTNYQTKCDKLYNKLDKNEFEIAIVGLEKAGKSTFGNALMENKILPDADERCTYTSTCIRYGQEDRATVKFYKSNEMDNVLQGYLQTIGIENAESYTYKTLSKVAYSELFNKLNQSVRNQYENTVNQDILNLLDNKTEILQNYVSQQDKVFKGDELYGEELKSYIVDPKVAVAVKEVNIEASKLNRMKNAVIYDVPGFDSPTSMHLEQTKARMKEADAIMLIASAEKPSFTAPALKIFQEVVDEDSTSLREKLFIFGNRADAANTLDRNIQTLQEEAKKWKLLEGEQLKERLMVGSAKAHLQKLGIVEGDYCIKKIEADEKYKNAWPYGDGIEYAYEKLVEYNKTVRFQVLKKRIQRNNEELLEISKELKEKYANGSTGADLGELLERTTSIKANAKKKIEKGLEELRRKIIEDYKEPVLSKRLQNKISELFNDEEKYTVTEEDLHKAELKINIVNDIVDVPKVEEMIREEKFEKIYEDFSKEAFSLAQEDHARYYKLVIDCFEKSLEMDKKSAYYDKLHKEVTNFVEKCKKDKEDEFIYQSIIERFVRDIMEILIRLPYGSLARVNKFVAEAEGFSGLVMFYNSGNADNGYEKQFLSVAPKNQPLLLALLFQEYKQSDECGSDIMKHIGTVHRSLCENSEVVQLVFSIVKKDPIGGMEAVKKLVSKETYKDCRSDEDFVKKVVPGLRALKKDINNEHNIGKYDFDFTNEENFKKQYSEFFGKNPITSYVEMRERFKVDLEILKKFLIHASIPAIRLEKPFITREVQSINKLLELVDSLEFDKMVDENSRWLVPEVYSSIDEAMENFAANKLAMEEADKILNTLKTH